VDSCCSEEGAGDREPPRSDQDRLCTGKTGDIVLVAGKGHETYQEISGVKHHFDDREVVRETFGMNNRVPTIILNAYAVLSVHIPRQGLRFSGAGVFQYISFRPRQPLSPPLHLDDHRKRLIGFLRRKQVGESIRDSDSTAGSEAGDAHHGGAHHPGGHLVPTLLFARLDNIYIIMVLMARCARIHRVPDDYIKVFKKDKKGLAGKFKVMGQIGLGLIVALTMYFHQDIVIRERANQQAFVPATEIFQVENAADKRRCSRRKRFIPPRRRSVRQEQRIRLFVADLMARGDYKKWTWLVFIPIVIFIIIAVSNGANLTDGLDGLATGTSAIIGVTLGILAYVSGNIVFANYLNIMYIRIPANSPSTWSAGRGLHRVPLVQFIPAQVFMGDTGAWPWAASSRCSRS